MITEVTNCRSGVARITMTSVRCATDMRSFCTRERVAAFLNSYIDSTSDRVLTSCSGSVARHGSTGEVYFRIQ